MLKHRKIFLNRNVTDNVALVVSDITFNFPYKNPKSMQ